MNAADLARRLDGHTPRALNLTHSASLDLVCVAFTGHDRNHLRGELDETRPPQHLIAALTLALQRQYITEDQAPELAQTLLKLNQSSPLEHIRNGELPWNESDQDASETVKEWISQCSNPVTSGERFPHRRANDPSMPDNHSSPMLHSLQSALGISNSRSFRNGTSRLLELGAPAWVMSREDGSGQILFNPTMPLNQRLGMTMLREIVGRCSISEIKHLSNLPLRECAAWGHDTEREILQSLISHAPEQPHESHPLPIDGEPELQISNRELIATLLLLIPQHPEHERLRQALRAVVRQIDPSHNAYPPIASLLKRTGITHPSMYDLPGWGNIRSDHKWHLERQLRAMPGHMIDSIHQMKHTSQDTHRPRTEREWKKERIELPSSKKNRSSTQQIQRARSWAQKGNRLPHALRLVFNLSPKDRVRIGMQGDTARLQQLEHGDPGVWQGVEAILIGERHVMPEGKCPLEGPNPVRLDQKGYERLREMGHGYIDQVQEDAFRRRRRARGRDWYEKGETHLQREEREIREAQREQSQYRAPGQIPKGARISKTANGRRIMQLIRLFAPDSRGFIDSNEGPTDWQAHKIMSHQDLGLLIGKGYLMCQPNEQEVKQMYLTNKSRDLLRSANIKLR